jgi:hypothetical protein
MPDTPVQKLTGTAFGLLFVAAGGGILLMAWRDPSMASAPMWVVEAACACFICAGLWAIAQTFGLTLIATLCGLAIVYLLAAPGLWMLFDGTGASCSVGAAVSGASIAGTAPSWMCRTIFGAGGLVTFAAALAFTWAAIFRRSRSNPSDSQDGSKAG